MKNSDLKYFLVWLIPIFGFAGFYFRSWFSPGCFYLAFLLIPFIEFFFPGTHKNFNETDKSARSSKKYFDILLYLNFPILYALLFYFVYILKTQSMHVTTWIFLVLNMGILIGVLGINVAHELGHRKHWFNQLVAQLLLTPALYMHFTQEHNYWHHKYVGTDLDPSTARKNEPVYLFWFRSIFGMLVNALKLEIRSLKNNGLPFIHWRNKLLVQSVIQAAYLLTILILAGITPFVSIIVSAIIGVLLLETINYIEHYGLTRQKSENGLYEAVNSQHSWNSDHLLGRIFLYELTRHPSHHEKTDLKYQNLDSLKQSPQLPYGYPVSLMMALIPPLWFGKMNDRLV